MQLANLIVDVLHYPKNINSCLTESTFPNDIKKTVVHLTHKKECNNEKSNYRQIDQLAFCQISLKFIKDS